MTTIITRQVGPTSKGSALTNAEVDQNFINLNEDKAEKSIIDSIEKAITGRVIINTWDLNSHVLIQSTEARCAVLDLQPGSGGTAISGAGEVICPATSKVYVVNNNTGYTVTFKTSSGTGVDIADNTSILLVCDGTNVIEGVTQSGGGAPIGAIQYFAGTTSTSYPGGSWLKCDGSIVSQATYPELHSKIGTLADGFYNIQNTILNPIITLSGNTIYAIKYLSGKYVAVGSGGYIGTSTNGLSWTTQDSKTANALYDFTYDGSKFIAVGASTTFITSTDAITWQTATTSGLSGSLGGVLYVSGKTYPYVICQGNRTDGAGTGVFSSTDGISWTFRFNGTRSTNFVGYVNDLYVVSGNGLIASSTDSVTWATGANPISQYNAAVGPISYINGRYICTATAGNAAAGTATSTDLITWTTQTGDAAGIGGATSVSDGSAVYIYGSAGFGLKTTDAVNWTKFPMNITAATYASVYNTGNYIISGANAYLRSSTDGETWASAYSLLYGASNGSIAVSGGVSGTIATSTNGTTWTSRTSGATTDIYKVRYLDDNKFWYVGASGAIGNSTDGITWSTVTSGTTATIYDIVYAGGKYVICGAAGLIKTSTDGAAWTTQFSAASYAFTTVNYINSKYVAMGGLSKTSTDGVTWEDSNFWQNALNPTGLGFSSVVKDNTLYICLSTSGAGTAGTSVVYKTTDAITFDQTFYITTGSVSGSVVTSINTVGDYLVLSGSTLVYGASTNTQLYISKDGDNWGITPKNQYNGYVNVTSLGTKIIALGGGVVGTANMYSYSTGSDFALPRISAGFCNTNADNSAYIKAL